MIIVSSIQIVTRRLKEITQKFFESLRWWKLTRSESLQNMKAVSMKSLT